MATLQQPLDTGNPSGVIGGPCDEGPATVPVKVFISYRHADTQIAAWMLYLKFKERFGAENVFFDQVALVPGMRWFEEIKSRAASARAFIALIGPKWLPSLTDHQQHGSDDYVARETELALQNDRAVTVIPVLVDDAELPDPGDLPPALKDLPARQAERLRNSQLPDDIDRLIARLREIPVLPPVPRPVLDLRDHYQTVTRSVPDLRDHYQTVARQADNLVVFLGAEANADDRAEQPWRPGCGTLPDDRDLARYLACHEGLDDTPPHLAEIAQYASTIEGEPELFRLVNQVFRVDPEPGPVHRYLAGLPARLGQRYQMIVTPKYDVALEKALRQADQAFDVAVYIGAGMGELGRFAHVPWQQQPQIIDKPSDYFGFPIAAVDGRLRRTVIVRVNGSVADQLFPWQDNYVITEDHYIDYLLGRPAEDVVPAQILAKLRNSSYLFLGYTMADWRLRVFLRGIWKGPRLGHAKYWAVEHEPGRLEKELWLQAGVSLYESSLTGYLTGLHAYLDDHPERAQP